MPVKVRKAIVVWCVCLLLVAGGAIAVSVAHAQKGEAVPAPSEEKGKESAELMAAKQLLLMMDADKDGRVSKKEWIDFMSAEFDRLDTNHDGFVDVKDMQKSTIQPAPFSRAGK